MAVPQLPASWRLTEGIPGRELKLRSLELLPWPTLLEPPTLISRSKLSHIYQDRYLLYCQTFF